MIQEQTTPEMQVLTRIEGKVNEVAKCMATMERRAVVAGAVSGAVSGSLAGGVVSTAILYIKFKLGF